MRSGELVGSRGERFGGIGEVAGLERFSDLIKPHQTHPSPPSLMLQTIPGDGFTSVHQSKQPD